jgi:hypothetical protein
MFIDPAEDIIKILYGPFEGKLYSMIKSKKKIEEPQLKSMLDNNELSEFDKAIHLLQMEYFIIINQKELPPDPNVIRRAKGTNKVKEIKFNDKFDFNTLFGKYKLLKEDVEEDFKRKEDEKYFCKKCKKKLNENLASRDNFICPLCNLKYSKSEEDLSDMKIKCKIVWDILDDRFKKKLDNLNQENYSNYINYLKAKYGNSIISNEKTNNQSCVFEEENDPYISSTLNDLERSNKEEEKLVFYELIEAFNKIKKK